MSKLQSKDGRGRIMNIAIWIIAIVEVVRLVQNTMQLNILFKETDMRERTDKVLDEMRDALIDKIGEDDE